MKIILKASFGNSYALIDLNVENLRTHNAYIHWKPELYTKASFCTFQCNAKYAQAGPIL